MTESCTCPCHRDEQRCRECCDGIILADAAGADRLDALEVERDTALRDLGDQCALKALAHHELEQAEADLKTARAALAGAATLGCELVHLRNAIQDPERGETPPETTAEAVERLHALYLRAEQAETAYKHGYSDAYAALVNGSGFHLEEAWERYKASVGAHQ